MPKANQTTYHACIDHWCPQSINCAHYETLQKYFNISRKPCNKYYLWLSSFSPLFLGLLRLTLSHLCIYERQQLGILHVLSSNISSILGQIISCRQRGITVHRFKTRNMWELIVCNSFKTKIASSKAVIINSNMIKHLLVNYINLNIQDALPEGHINTIFTLRVQRLRPNCNDFCLKNLKIEKSPILFFQPSKIMFWAKSLLLQRSLLQHIYDGEILLTQQLQSFLHLEVVAMDFWNCLFFPLLKKISTVYFKGSLMHFSIKKTAFLQISHFLWQ